MATNNTTTAAPTTPPAPLPPEQTPLKAETDVAKVESGVGEETVTEKSQVDDLKEKLKKRKFLLKLK